MNGLLDLDSLYYDSVGVVVQDVDLSGTWNFSFISCGSFATGTAIVNQTSATSFSGSYTSNLGGYGTYGTFTGTISGKYISFTITQTTPSCPGNYEVIGTLNSTNTKITGTVSGSDCVCSNISSNFIADKL